MECEFTYLSTSSDSNFSDDEFSYVRNGEYTKFDSFDDDIKMIKSSSSPDDHLVISEQYFKYDSYDAKELTCPSPEKEIILISKVDEIDVNQNITPEFVSKYDEVLKELQELSNPTKIDKTNPLVVLRKRLQARMSNDFSKLAKRPTFLHKFRGKSKLSRTFSIPKIFVCSPETPEHELYRQMDDRPEQWTSNQKLYVSSKKKAMRKSI